MSDSDQYYGTYPTHWVVGTPTPTWYTRTPQCGYSAVVTGTHDTQTPITFQQEY